MNPQREPTFADYAALVAHDGDTEVVILRAHMLLERKLWELLAKRLHVALSDLPERMNFATVASLALAGNKHLPLRSAILDLNAIRNRLAHRFDYADLATDTSAWISAVELLDAGFFTPPSESFRERLTDCIIWIATVLMDLSTSALKEERALLELSIKELEPNLSDVDGKLLDAGNQKPASDVASD